MVDDFIDNRYLNASWCVIAESFDFCPIPGPRQVAPAGWAAPTAVTSTNGDRQAGLSPSHNAA